MKKRKSLSRRLFLGQCAAAPFIVSQLGNSQPCRAEDAVPEPTPSDSPETGKPYAGWKEGDLDLHFIYTGRSESCYHIFPDGTSILIDTGDLTPRPGIPALPNQTKRAGEWVARYIKQVNPAGDHVDYMMCSHFHSDHCGYDNNNVEKTSGRGEDTVFPAWRRWRSSFILTRSLTARIRITPRLLQQCVRKRFTTGSSSFSIRKRRTG